MDFNKVKFERPVSSDFSTTLKKRINDYFQTNQISRFGNSNMVIKSIVMLSLFVVPAVILSSGIVNSVWWLFILYLISAAGMTGIGMNVMHDAIHGSYSKDKKVNKYMGYTMNLIGANSKVWLIQHNILHHTYTNIEGLDDDINAPIFLRFSPNTKFFKIHRFQHIYVWFFYGLSTFSWITVKDFTRMARYKKMGFLNKKNEYRNEMIKLIFWKILYYSYSLILPLIMLPLSPWLILAAFFMMHFVTGLVTTIVFQTAHVVPETEFPMADKSGSIKNDWFIHQLETTCNFAPKSRLMSWFIGGLNFQIEHHLFPNICHVHYKNLTAIVKKTAEEYQLPYSTSKTFFSAVYGHYKMLRSLSKA